jgi:uncharacterized protein YjbI with pentapeptide repeats
MIGSAAESILEKITNKESLERADLRDLVLNHATLENVRLCRSDLEGANFEGANLRHADLSCANLREAYMAGVDLEGANLQKANLEGANLEGGASPGIVGPRRLHVGQTGTVVAAVQQAFTLTEFGFEHGCSLSLKIRKSPNFKGENDVRKPNHKADCLGGRNGV